MNYLHLNNQIDGVVILADKISEYLRQNKKVLWLLSGGSNISISVEVLKILKSGFGDKLKTNLAVTLTDERYGSVGHIDSNWQQLIHGGFDMEAVQAVPVLFELPLEQTTKKFGEDYQALTLWADVIIGQFGIGPDGHTAGVLPGTIGATDTSTACSYVSDRFIRISLTLKTIELISYAYVFAFGESKREVIHSLQIENISLIEMPAQIFKKMSESYLFTDQI
jgi:6-phosphogluconolactonase/glucosamine-6-phosphate isomerase/deaminase